MNEEWRKVLGYEDFYEVSNLGNIRSLDRNVKTTNRGVYLRKGKILSKSINSFGYECVGLTINSETTIYRVHRLVTLSFIDNPNNYPCVNHIDGIKTNNNIDNLEWVTYSENSIHAFKHKLTNPINPILKGEYNGRALLNEQQVKEIRLKYIPYKYSAKKLSKEYNVSESCITHILNNTSWNDTKT